VSDRPDLDRYPELQRSWDRRQFIKSAAVGTVFMAFGGALVRIIGEDLTREASAEKLSDGRKRLPPGQKVIKSLKPMGGDEGDGKVETFRLKVHGAVQKPFEVDYASLLKLPQAQREIDVHCVTGWSMLGGLWKGVNVTTLAEAAAVKGDAKYIIFEAANGYTTNVRLDEGLAGMVTYRLDGKPLSLDHGAPVRGLVPNLYFWKSAKWITGIKFVREDQPGYWETRGYHNHADPWKEERYG